MPSGRMIKLVVYEVLQVACLSVPIFVVMERFASLMLHVRGDLTAYWLVVAASIAYVTSVSLLVWVPLRYLVLKQRTVIRDITQWRPTTLAYVILCTLPCFSILIAGSKVQVDKGPQYRQDHFSELPISLVLFSLICVDIIERIRPCSLTGQADRMEMDLDMPGPVLTHLEQVNSVSGQLYYERGQNEVLGNGSATGRWRDQEAVGSRPASAAYLYSSSHSHSGPLRVLWSQDMRSEVFVHSFLFWMDVVELVRVAGIPDVFYSGWVFAVYILAFLSCLRLAVTPHSALLPSAGFFLQDLPFLLLRLALISVHGYITPLLYPMKNLLVCLTFTYFNFLTKLRLFRRESMF
ncbi:transmembrane protein 236 isoform X1 [Salmo trutta]|uniref:Transmembrane protein 236 n=1 Tax=Salmo trutta TaxID=8032 RepID=A0A673XDC1_SALTR|nr:transmembrane protein 236-like isoform X1 [Salmo trutta]